MKDGGAKEFRLNVGYELLMLMERNDDLPLPNIHRLSKVLDEYFFREGMNDFVKDENYKWESSPDYWRTHMSEVSKFMRKRYKLYFGFMRDDGRLTGVWRFMNKGEWERTLKRGHSDIATRTDTHNDKVDDTSLRWKTDVPRIADVPRLS